MLTTPSRVKIYSINRTKPMTAKRLKQFEEKGQSIWPITRPVPFDLETEEEYLEQMKLREGRDPEE
jgi:sulfite oxidase